MTVYLLAGWEGGSRFLGVGRGRGGGVNASLGSSGGHMHCGLARRIQTRCGSMCLLATWLHLPLHGVWYRYASAGHLLHAELTVTAEAFCTDRTALIEKLHGL